VIVVLAHAGHWLVGVAYAAAPLSVIAAIGFIAWRERRGSD
jgi:hypothetical protein